MNLLRQTSITLFLVLLTGYVMVACQSTRPDIAKPEVSKAPMVACKDPRPQMCTREYRPVCAKRDTGVRCVTTPCPSEEWVTKSNACTACSDEKVFGYLDGACP